MNIVKELRKKKGIQQKELAIITGVAQPTVSEWESNKKDPSGERLRKLAEYFGVDELVILGAMSPKPPSADSHAAPQTIEARIISSGVDRMSKEQREQALAVLRAMFAQHPELFEEGDTR